MKKIRFFLALSIMIMFLTTCDKSNQISVLKLKTNELVRISGDTIRIFSESKTVAIDPDLLGSDSLQKNLPLAYQNPGKKFTASETKRQLYSANSFWTKFTITTASKLMHYNPAAQSIVSGISVNSIDGINVFPILIFLLLFILIILNTLGFDDKPANIIFCVFILSNIALSAISSIDLMNTIFNTIVSAILIGAVNLILLLIMLSLLTAFKANKIPTFNKRRDHTAIVISLAVAISIRFSFFFELDPAYLYLVILFFLSPNIIAWLYMIIRYMIKLIRAGNEKLRQEKLNEEYFTELNEKNDDTK